VIKELGDSHADVRRLREELAECNTIFAHLSSSAREEGIHCLKNVA